MLTYHDPQMKYWRNMKTDSRILSVDWFIASTGG